jgi:hypothetical protein
MVVDLLDWLYKKLGPVLPEELATFSLGLERLSLSAEIIRHFLGIEMHLLNLNIVVLRLYTNKFCRLAAFFSMLHA